MLARDLERVAQSLGDHVQREGAGPVGFPAGAKVLEQPLETVPFRW